MVQEVAMLFEIRLLFLYGFGFSDENCSHLLQLLSFPLACYAGFWVESCQPWWFQMVYNFTRNELPELFEGIFLHDSTLSLSVKLWGHGQICCGYIDSGN